MRLALEVGVEDGAVPAADAGAGGCFGRDEFEGVAWLLMGEVEAQGNGGRVEPGNELAGHGEGEGGLEVGGNPGDLFAEFAAEAVFGRLAGFAAAAQAGQSADADVLWFGTTFEEEVAVDGAEDEAAVGRPGHVFFALKKPGSIVWPRDVPVFVFVRGRCGFVSLRDPTTWWSGHP